MRYLKLYLLFSLAVFFFACADDDEGDEFSFDREISEVSVLKECASDAPEGSVCFKIRYRYPIRLKNYSGLCVWLDTTIVDSTSRSVSDKQIDKAHSKSVRDAFFVKYDSTSGSYYDTLDLTDSIAHFIEDGYKTLQVAMFSEYSDDGDPGALQRVFLSFVDDQPPSKVEPLKDSVWSTGAMFEWYRPMDRTDILTPGEYSGLIFGYNIVIWAKDADEDLSKLKITLQSPDGVDYEGNRLYKRHAHIHTHYDSLLVDSSSNIDKQKNYLHLVVFDGKGYDTQNINKNRFRLFIEGLRTQSETEKYQYTIGLSSWDMAGNYSGSEMSNPVDSNQVIRRTDSIAPLMAKRIFTEEDSLFPGFAKLDSNNRLRIFWSRSLDPLSKNHGIEVDSELVVPRGCNENSCYKIVSHYEIEYYNKLDDSWNAYSYAGGKTRYSERYGRDEDGHFYRDYTGVGSFVTDTIRWVAPGDTLILRIRGVDNSGYYSAALVDSVFVSPGDVAADLNCPEGFVAVSTSDTTSFCMERFEHRDDDGKFMTGVLHSEALAACEGISASGFEVSLCGERDWELVCLSGGSLAYGVIEENGSEASDYLFRVCNVGTGNAELAANVTMRDPGCMNSMGVRDLPGQYQEWVRGRSEDTAAVLKGSSYMVFNGLDRESIAYCTNRAFPYYTRPGYTLDTVYLYREGTKIDTVYAADTTRTLYEKLTPKDFRDTLQFYDVVDANGKTIGEDFSLYREYKKGGKSWLDSLANGLTYKPSSKKVVFLTGEKLHYREAASFYKSPAVGFRCCAYKK
ncbi:hypothetical protein [Fibrobacter sp. UWB3]|jgi:hypothetical protein|uniref:hypothetical protein n=1 Tax=Fibrobacter sp. UWB3 TaxID=1964357 RepID=UPI0020CEE156|nr:hypothetical protein [Fibrobacter sp. UWB3]